MYLITLLLLQVRQEEEGERLLQDDQQPQRTQR